MMKGASKRRSPKSVLVALTQDDPAKPPSAWCRARVDGTAHTLACGHFHFLALAEHGECFSWGRGSIGLLGHESEEDEALPMRIAGLAQHRCTSIACGPYHSAAVIEGGQLFVWGWTPFASAQGAQQSFVKAPRHVAVAGAARVAGVACGCFATAAWDSDGELYTWGRAGSGQLGHGSSELEVEPRAVEALAGVRVEQAAFGGKQSSSEHTGFLLVRSAAGMLFSCGSARDGRLGRQWSADEEAGGGTASAVHHGLPGEVRLGDDGLATAACLAAADDHAAAVTTRGELYVWGSNTAGVLGEAAPVVAAPMLVASVPPLKHVACAAYTTAGLGLNGEVLLLGGDPSAPRKPRLAVLPGKASALFAGGFHVGVLLAEQTPEKEKRAPEPRELSAFSQAAYDGMPAELQAAVGPEIAQLLLDDCAGAPPLQLRHELRLLRDLLKAERSKLDEATGSGKPKVVECHSPSAGTWTDSAPGELPFRPERPKEKGAMLHSAPTALLHAR